MLGVRDEETSKKLIREGSHLTLTKAREICEADEAAKRDQQCILSQPTATLNATRGYRNKSTYKSKDQRRDRDTTCEETLNRQSCKWCGYATSHAKERSKCPAHGKTCRLCDKPNHFAKVCRASKSHGKVSSLIATVNDLETDLPTPTIPVMVNDTLLEVMPDTGANVNAMGPHMLKQLKIKQHQLHSSNTETTAANGTPFHTLGKFHATIALDQRSSTTCFHVLRELNNKPAILKWTSCIDLGIVSDNFPRPHKCSQNFPSPGHVTRVESTTAKSRATSSHAPDTCSNRQLLQAHAEPLHALPRNATSSPGSISEVDVTRAFSKAFDTQVRKSMEGEPFRIQLKKGSQPISVNTPRKIPICLRDKLKDELDDLESAGIIMRVTQPTEWCAPIVIAPKKDSEKIRLCVDFRKLNQHILRERYITPTAHELVAQANLDKAKFFTVCDAVKGYHQVALDEESCLLTTFITPFGRYCYRKAPFGICSISEHYNRRLDEAFIGLPRVFHVVDDCLIASDTWEQHLEDVSQFLRRCEEKNITLNPNKFVFAKKSVTFAGLQLTPDGHSIDPSLLRAVKDYPTPTNQTDVRSFFGLVNQVGNYTSQLSSLCKPLQPLLRKNCEFMWEESHQMAFDKIREHLSQDTSVIAFFDPRKQTRLKTDASRLKGLGFILEQLQEDGSWRIVQAGSRFISDTESRYAMIEIELLAITWAFQKCRMFLEGLT